MKTADPEGEIITKTTRHHEDQKMPTNMLFLAFWAMVVREPDRDGPVELTPGEER